MKRYLLTLAAMVLASQCSSTPAAAQSCSGQLPPNTFCANPTGAQAPARATSATDALTAIGGVPSSGPNNDPSLTAIRGIQHLTGTNTITLNTGITATAPYGAWLQTKDTGSGGGGSGTAYPLRLNPLGSSVGINTSSPNANVSLQVKDNWCDNTYEPFGTPCNLLEGAYFFTPIASYTRTSDRTGAALSLTGFAFADSVTQKGAWPLYTEAHRMTDLDFSGNEFSVVNRFNQVAYMTPYGPSVTGHGGSGGLQIDCGNSYTIAQNGTQYSCNFIMNFVRNAGADQVNLKGFGTGINFATGVMDMTQNDPAPAITFPSSSTEHYAISWYTTKTNPVWKFYSDASSTSAQNTLVLHDAYISSSVQIRFPGTITNDSAPTGGFGEYKDAPIVFGSSVPLTISGQAYTIASISLTAGDWDVCGVVHFNPAGSTTTTGMFASISLISNALDVSPDRFQMWNSSPAVAPNGIFSVGISQCPRISIAGTTTVYLVGESVFAVSTISAYGYIRARRAR